MKNGHETVSDGGCGSAGHPVLLRPSVSHVHHLGTCDSWRSGNISGCVTDTREGKTVHPTPYPAGAAAPQG